MKAVPGANKIKLNKIKQMKEITIQVPDGKNAERVNGVLTLADEEVKDSRTVTERIKTFKDACEELGEEHPLVKQYCGRQFIDLWADYLFI